MRLSELPLLTLALIFIIPGLILIAFCAWLFWLGINFILIQGHQYRSEPIVGGFVFVDVNDNGQEISEEEKRKLPEKA